MKEDAESHALNTSHSIFAVIVADQDNLRIKWSCSDCEARDVDEFPR